METPARKLTTGQTPEGRPAQWGLQTETAYAPLLCFVRSFGGEMLDPGHLGKKVAFDRPPAKQALQYLYDLRHRHRVHPIAGVDQVAMINGNLAMQTTLMSGGFQWARQVADRFEIKNALIPKGPTGKRGSQGHVDMLGIYNKTKYPDEAFGSCKWFANKETSAALFEEVGVPGARFDGWNDPKVATNPLVKPFKDFLENPGPGADRPPPTTCACWRRGRRRTSSSPPCGRGSSRRSRCSPRVWAPSRPSSTSPRVTTGELGLGSQSPWPWGGGGPEGVQRARGLVGGEVRPARRVRLCACSSGRPCLLRSIRVRVRAGYPPR